MAESARVMGGFDDVRSGFHAALIALSDFVRVDTILAAQIGAGRERFFAGVDAGAVAAGAERFLEWFTLERRVDGTGGPPVIAYLGAGCPGLDPEHRCFVESLAASKVGVFTISEVDAASFAADDAISAESYEVWMPLEARRAHAGSTLVGRIARVPGSPRWYATDACEVFAGTELYEAYAKEAARQRVTGSADDLVLSQLELERVLQARTEDGADVATIERELAAFLANVERCDLPSASDVSYALSVADRPGAVLGPFLEQLAWDTSLDIERAQRLCLRLWNVHRAAPATEPPAPAATEDATPPAENLGAALLAEIDAGIERGEDLESLFSRVEGMIAGDEPAGEPEELRWHTTDVGDIDALTAEWAWERERSGQPVELESAKRLAALGRWLQERGVRDADRIEDAHLLAAVVEDWARGNALESIGLLGVVASWSEWLRDVQDLELRCDAAGLADTLRRERERCERLEATLADRAGTATHLGSWRVLDGEAATWLLECAGRQIELPRSLPFVAGDLVLGEASAAGFLEGCRVIPSLLAEALGEAGR